MQSTEIWRYIHAERASLVTTLRGLEPEQWLEPSWCEGWTVKQVAGHITAAAEQTFPNFYLELAAAGFRFDVFARRGADKVAMVDESVLIDRLAARTTTTNHPPAPVLAMLGEIVVHGQDIRRPLGLTHRSPEAALIAVAEGWKKSNLLIGSKRRITGLSLQATDSSWSYGTGPKVEGPLQDLVLAMTGRKGALVGLTGPGVEILTSRP